ncbi:MAG: MobA-like NTP transferase domain containing protein, partial [Desulfobacterales bacterium]
MDTPQPAFTAIVLAADRGPGDPVAKAAGVPCKSLTPVDGTPMIFRVLGALAASREVEQRILCGPPKAILKQEPKLGDLIASGE